MTSDKAAGNKASKKPEAATSGKSKSKQPPQATSWDREENKVPYAAENIEHTIRRAMREKEKLRKKNPGHYL